MNSTRACAPIVLSAMCFTFAAIVADEVHWTVLDGAVYGLVVYLAAWVIGRLAARRWDLRVLFFDLFCWIGAGAAVTVAGIGGVSGVLTLLLGSSGVTAATKASPPWVPASTDFAAV